MTFQTTDTATAPTNITQGARVNVEIIHIPSQQKIIDTDTTLN